MRGKPRAQGKDKRLRGRGRKLLGITDIYRIGGAQAIYAFAYGTESVPKVDMIVGPGNAYVEEAKRDVYGTVGIDMLAGPTELVILCTEAFSPKLIALSTMFSQAEHDELASVGIFSPSLDHLNRSKTEHGRAAWFGGKERNDTARRSRQTATLCIIRKLTGPSEAINIIAPEHMELIGDEGCLPDILYPGVIYVGPYTPVAMGDYYIGTNHVLPTAGAGRFSAGLSVDRFTKRKVVVKIDRSFIQKYGDRAERLARLEGSARACRCNKSTKGARIMKLKIGLPKGSLQESTFKLFKNAGYTIKLRDRSYVPVIDDNEMEGLVIRAQEMARYVENGILDMGITGLDWVMEQDAKVVELVRLRYGKVGFRGVKWVVAVPE